MTKRKRPTNPVSYKCANPKCTRTLIVSSYSPSYPSADTPDERVHRISDSSIPGFSMLCTCGNFTIVAARHPPYGDQTDPA